MSLMKKKHCFTIQKKRSKLLHHNKLITSHIKQTNIRYSAAHFWFVMNPSRQKLRPYYFSDFSTLYLLGRTISTGILSYSCPCQNWFFFSFHAIDICHTYMGLLVQLFVFRKRTVWQFSICPGCLEYKSGKVASYLASKENYKLFTIMQN